MRRSPPGTVWTVFARVAGPAFELPPIWADTTVPLTEPLAIVVWTPSGCLDVHAGVRTPHGAQGRFGQWGPVSFVRRSAADPARGMVAWDFPSVALDHAAAAARDAMPASLDVWPNGLTADEFERDGPP